MFTVKVFNQDRSRCSETDYFVEPFRVEAIEAVQVDIWYAMEGWLNVGPWFSRWLAGGRKRHVRVEFTVPDMPDEFEISVTRGEAPPTDATFQQTIRWHGNIGEVSSLIVQEIGQDLEWRDEDIEKLESQKLTRHLIEAAVENNETKVGQCLKYVKDVEICMHGVHAALQLGNSNVIMQIIHFVEEAFPAAAYAAVVATVMCVSEAISLEPLKTMLTEEMEANERLANFLIKRFN